MAENVLSVVDSEFDDFSDEILLDASTSKQTSVQSYPPGGGFLASDDSDGIPICMECSGKFPSSFLYDTFAYPVCNACRDKEKHDLMTKTDAKDEYLLKDCDFDRREPQLKFYRKKNPHNPHSDMKLYLRCQIEDRALEVWGTPEALELALEKRKSTRDKMKQKRFERKIKDLRMSVRSNLYKKDARTHVHDYGEETFDQKSDSFYKLCSTCSHKFTYEKM